VDGQDGVARVVLVVEQGPELAVLQALGEAGEGGLDVGGDVLALGLELRQDVDFILLVLDFGEELDVPLQALFLLLEGLGRLLVLPDLGGGETLVDGFALGFLVIEVKESPAALRACRRSRRGAS